MFFFLFLRFRAARNSFWRPASFISTNRSYRGVFYTILTLALSIYDDTLIEIATPGRSFERAPIKADRLLLRWPSVSTIFLYDFKSRYFFFLF